VPAADYGNVAHLSKLLVAGCRTRHFSIRTQSPPSHGLYRVYGILYDVGVEHRISATDLARKLGDVLGRVRYGGDSFVVEQNGDPVARLVPLPEKTTSSLREALAAWHAAGARDLTFADDLEGMGRV
jgi:prevent-host-death family protein